MSKKDVKVKDLKWFSNIQDYLEGKTLYYWSTNSFGGDYNIRKTNYKKFIEKPILKRTHTGYKMYHRYFVITEDNYILVVSKSYCGVETYDTVKRNLNFQNMLFDLEIIVNREINRKNFCKIEKFKWLLEKINEH